MVHCAKPQANIGWWCFQWFYNLCLCVVVSVRTLCVSWCGILSGCLLASDFCFLIIKYLWGCKLSLARKHESEHEFVSITIAIGGMNIDMRLVNFRKFIEEHLHYSIVLCGERWCFGTQTFPNDSEGKFYESTCVEQREL